MSAPAAAPGRAEITHGDGDAVGTSAGIMPDVLDLSDLPNPFGSQGLTPSERTSMEREVERKQNERERLTQARQTEASVRTPFVPFPTEAVARLAPAAAANIVASAAAIGCDQALIALPALSVLGAGVGNSHRVEIKSSWWEPSLLWTAIVSPSGTSKSPALDAALGPVYSLEREAKEQHVDQMELYEEEARKYATLDKKAKVKAAPPTPPTQVRYRLGDTTTEGVAAVHAVNPRGLLVARDEGGGWLGGRDRYASGDADSFIWNELGGSRAVVVDRKGGGTFTIERPAVSVAIGLQPGILSSKLSAADFVSGFAARVLMAQPPTRPREWSEADVTPDVISAYHDLVRALYARPEGGAAIPLSPDAKDLFKRWVNDNGRKTALLPESDPLRSAFSKVEGYAARFALIFHLCAVVHGIAPEATPPPVSAEAMQAGIEVACWFRYELARIYDLHGFRRGASNVPTDRNEALAAQLPTPFSAGDVETLWGIGQSAAYTVIKKLERAGLAEKKGPGVYAPLFPTASPEKVERAEKLEMSSLLMVEDRP